MRRNRGYQEAVGRRLTPPRTPVGAAVTGAGNLAAKSGRSRRRCQPQRMGSAARARADGGRYTPRCRRKKPTVRFHASAAAASL